MSNKIITANNVSVTRNNKNLLNKISLEIDENKVTVILGHNGAGKTLLLWTLHGLITPDKGTVLAPHLSCQRMVFQRPIILRRSARQYFRFLCPNATRTTIHYWFEKAKLLHRIDSPARQLSGGEAQKLSLIGALAYQPKILFLDEPTSHLDFESTCFFESQIKKVQSSGTSIIMISHNRAQAERVSDNILFMEKGKIVEAQSAQTFFASPKSKQAQIYLEHA